MVHEDGKAMKAGMLKRGRDHETRKQFTCSFAV